MNIYTARFHLGAGPNFKHWQIRGDYNVSYYDPAKIGLIFYEARLKNIPNKANKVFQTQVRDVSGFIQCGLVDFHKEQDIIERGWEELLYDPKIVPHWRSSFFSDRVYDNKTFRQLCTIGRRVFVVE